jgi:hypothetical protein
MPKEYLSSMGPDIGIAAKLEADYPGRIFTVVPVGYRWDFPPGVATGMDPDYRKLDRALKTQAHPVLVSLQRSPFRAFTAEEFARPLLNCRGPGGCVSIFKGSTLTLGQMADAVVHVGAAEAGSKAKPAR